MFEMVLYISGTGGGSATNGYGRSDEVFGYDGKSVSGLGPSIKLWSREGH